MAEQWPRFEISLVLRKIVYVFVHHEHNKSSDKFIIMTPGLRFIQMNSRKKVSGQFSEICFHKAIITKILHFNAWHCC